MRQPRLRGEGTDLALNILCNCGTLVDYKGKVSPGSFDAMRVLCLGSMLHTNLLSYKGCHPLGERKEGQRLASSSMHQHSILGVGGGGEVASEGES